MTHQSSAKGNWTSCTPKSTKQFSVPQGWLVRRVCMSLRGTTLWVSAHHCATACQHRLNVPDPPGFMGHSIHAFSVWQDVCCLLPATPGSSTCVPPVLPAPLQFWCFWCHDSDKSSLQSPVHLPDYITVSYNKPFTLIAPDAALSHISETQHRKLQLLFRDIGRSELAPLVIPQRDHVLRALTMQIGRALIDRNLGI